MGIDNDEYIDFSLSQKDTLIHKLVAETPRPEIPLVPRTLKKTRLERLPLRETISAVMRVIRGVRVERLGEYFEQTCDRRQHDTAVICGSFRLTYQELDHQANRLAHFLISRGVGEGNPVGILLDRSLDTYIALLGVLKAGAAFVPLDPSFPADLVGLIAEDAGLCGIVTTCTFRDKMSALACPVLELDQAYKAISDQPETRPQVRVDPTSLCYIIYTFGTTGRPKGVAVSHANIVNFLRVVTPIYGVTRNDRVFQGMSTAFDFSLGEIWPTWIAGATLVTDSPDSQRPDHGITEFLIEREITILCCMPALLATIEIDVPSLRTLLVVGEACPVDLVGLWLRKGRRVLKTYGPAETMVTATWCELSPGRSITIGSPLPTSHIYILDSDFCLVEHGESGEICIGSPGVAIGYLNHSDIKKDRFIPNPVWHDREILPHLYRTGDLGHITPSGEIEYLGRFDAQVKVHDYRIERGDIEQVVLAEANTGPLKVYTPVSGFEGGAVSELEAGSSRLRILKQINVKNIYQHAITDPLYKNSIFNMSGTFILGGLGFVFWIIIARLYKAEDVGIATTLISLMTLLSGLTIMGLHSSLTRYLPKSVNKNELINSSFVIVTLVALLASTIFFLGLPIFSPQLIFIRSNIFYIISFTFFIILCSWNVLVENIFIAFRAAHNILMKNIIISILKLVLPFALIAFSAYGIFASAASALALGTLAALIILRMKFKIRPSISVNFSLIKEVSKYSFANYIAGFMISMPSLVLPVIILNILSARYAAYYYIASMIQNALLIVPLAATQALLAEGSYDEAELKKHVIKAITIILAILIPATLIIILFGNILLQFFGKNYATEALLFLQLYSFSTIFTSLLLIANTVLNVKHKIKSLVISNALAAVFTLSLSYAFISGKLVGIGWGWTLGQAIAGLVSLYFITRSNSATSQSRASPGKAQRGT
jgi:amino acid adenylation domain-containing protein